LLRDSDSLARFGGDEFLIILDGIADLKDSELIVESIYQSFLTPFFVDENEIFVTVSSGISVSPRRRQRRRRACSLCRFGDVPFERARQKYVPLF
jgi:GGDEF domain-containing protein